MNGSFSEPRERLLLALAEQLKLPLLQIARDTELASSDANLLQTVSHTANMAMQLIDGYILSLSDPQAALELEPVSVSAVLQDAAHRLAPTARHYDCEMHMSVTGKYGPVMAHRQNLEMAFTMLGYSLITSKQEDAKRAVVLGAHKSSTGMVAGVFSDQPGLSSEALKRAKALYGSARQPFSSLASNSSAGVFIADALLQAIAAPLKLSRHQKLTGLATTLHPSQQLSFTSLSS